MEFIQTITPDDIINYNFFLLDQRKMLKINTKAIGLLALGFLIYSALNKNVFGACLFAILFCYSFFLFFPLQRFFIRKKTLKRASYRELKIKMKLDEQGIYYALEKESDVAVYPWEKIQIAHNTLNYFFIRVDYYTHLIIKKTAVPDLTEIENLFETKLIKNIRYQIK